MLELHDADVEEAAHESPSSNDDSDDDADAQARAVVIMAGAPSRAAPSPPGEAWQNNCEN